MENVTIHRSTEMTVEASVDDAEVRVHYTFSDGEDDHRIQIVITDEGMIVDAFLNDESVGTSAEQFDDMFRRLAGWTPGATP